MPRRYWKSSEDAALARCVKLESFGLKMISWKRVQFLLLKENVRRSAKQCRERWLNHICPEVSNDAWSMEEDKRLIWLYLEHGAKWKEISEHIATRSENGVKNRYMTLQRAKDTESRHASDDLPLDVPVTGEFGTLFGDYV